MTIEDAWQELNDFLTGDDLGPSNLGALEVDGQDAANRAGRALARLQRDEDEMRAVVQAERDRLDAFLADRMAGIDRARSRISEGLEGYIREEKARRGVSTIKLPSVTLSVKKGLNRIEGVIDESFATERPTLTRVIPARFELDKVAAKKDLQPGPKIGAGPTHDIHQAVDADGVAVEGITFEVPRFPTFRYELRSGTEAEPEAER